MNRHRGFTLVELLIVVVIVSLLMSIGVPSYRDYMRRAGRADGTTALLRIASAQERWFIANGQYASNAQLGLAPPAGLGIPSSERGNYDLSILPAAGGLAFGYTAQAAIAGGGDQADDAECAMLTINERGIRAAQTDGGAENTDNCWR